VQNKKQGATTEQVELAIAKLTKDDWLKLWKVAARTRFWTYFGADDVMQQALTAALELERRWNTNYSFCSFLYGAMRSIASNERRLLRNKMEWPAAELVDADEPDNDCVLHRADGLAQLRDVPANAAEAEANELLEQRVATIYALFSDDLEVTGMMRAMEAGCRGEDIRRRCGMTRRQYEAARKRMNRRLHQSRGSR
jgi:hypothetical protein